MGWASSGAIFARNDACGKVNNRLWNSARGRMPFRVGARIAVSQQQPRGRGVAVLACLTLLAGTVFLLWIGRGFADYALTGWFWNRSEGVVLGGDTSSSPLVEFSTPDGATHTFTEDYILLCAGRRSFCLIRDFKIGEAVPVVYDPSHPRIAYSRLGALFQCDFLAD